MIFTTRSFLIFFTGFLALYFSILATARHRKDKNAVNKLNLLTLASSFVFYGWSQPQYILLLLVSGAVDFFAAKSISCTNSIFRKKIYLSLSIACNLGILFTFKYSDFALSTLQDFFDNTFIGMFLPSTVSSIRFEEFSIFKNVILPAGISFYTFQSMSYTIDVYRGLLVPTGNFFKFMTYLSFFPQLVAGPIERAAALLPQFDYIKKFKTESAISGFQLIAWGVFKKLVIADNIGKIVDQVYTNYVPGSGSFYKTLLAGAGFGIQIYMDFSAYSEIAVGLALILGFNIMVNFKQPYMRANIREFWRSWNISLSQWFRDYIYFPLSTRLENLKLRRELIQTSGVLSVFAISGLWHGSGYTFIIWGLINGLAYIVSVPLSVYKLDIWDKIWPLSIFYGGIKHFFTLIVVCISWIYFRSTSINQANSIIADSTKLSFSHLNEAKSLLGSVLPLQDLLGVVAALIIVFTVEFIIKDRAHAMTIFDIQKNPYTKLITFLILFFAIQAYGSTTDAAFIYFNF